jgi:hypothetical protein
VFPRTLLFVRGFECTAIAGGEVIVLSFAGYVPFTVTKSIFTVGLEDRYVELAAAVRYRAHAHRAMDVREDAISNIVGGH